MESNKKKKEKLVVLIALQSCPWTRCRRADASADVDSSRPVSSKTKPAEEDDNDDSDKRSSSEGGASHHQQLSSPSASRDPVLPKLPSRRQTKRSSTKRAPHSAAPALAPPNGAVQ